MLVLSRRIGEEIVIDGNIRVVVTGVQGDRVRLGVFAPLSVCVERKEVHERRQPEWTGQTPQTNNVSPDFPPKG